MAIIYFDQRVWIDLLKSNKGIKNYSDYQDIYNKVIETSNSEKHKYPVSACHIMETQKRSDHKSRYELLKFILETSKLNSIVTHSKILGLEVRNAILASLNIEMVDLSDKVFGNNLEHCFGQKNTSFKDIKDIDFLISIMDNPGRKSLVEETNERDKKLAESIEQFRVKILDHPDKHKRKDIAEAYEHYHHYSKILTEEMMKLGLFFEDIEHIFEDKTTYQSFWINAPSIHIFQIMDYARNSNISRKVRPNDLYDLQCISIASAYCDIVVTEREWANILNQNNIGELYKTEIVYKIEELRNLL